VNNTKSSNNFITLFFRSIISINLRVSDIIIKQQIAICDEGKNKINISDKWEIGQTKSQTFISQTCEMFHFICKELLLSD